MSHRLFPLIAVAVGVSQITPALAHDIGDVEAVNHNAYGTPLYAAQEAKQRGDKVSDHEWLETLRDSGLRVRLADGSQLTLGADSKVRVDKFSYDPAHANSDATAGAALSLRFGFMRYVTGSMPKGHTTIETPTATVTLRGTSVALAVNQRGETLLVVDDGEVAVRSKLTGQQVGVGPGGSLDIKGDEIVKSEQTGTGDPAVDRGLSAGSSQQANEAHDGGTGDSTGGGESGSDASGKSSRSSGSGGGAGRDGPPSSGGAGAGRNGPSSGGGAGAGRNGPPSGGGGGAGRDGPPSSGGAGAGRNGPPSGGGAGAGRP